MQKKEAVRSHGMLTVGSKEHLPLCTLLVVEHHRCNWCSYQSEAVTTQRSPNIPPQQTFSSTFSVTGTHLQLSVLGHGRIQHSHHQQIPCTLPANPDLFSKTRPELPRKLAPEVPLLPDSTWAVSSMVFQHREPCVCSTHFLPSFPSPSLKSSHSQDPDTSLPWPLFPDAS